MKDYPGTRLDEKRQRFNEHLNTARVKVEQTFGDLKNCWRILSKKSEINVYFMPKVVAACCTMHNIMFIEDLNSTDLNSNHTFQKESFENINAVCIRDALCDLIESKRS